MDRIVDCKILYVTRMSPRIATRSRFLAETLSREYDVRVISEVKDYLDNYNENLYLGKVIVKEVKLAFGNKRIWHFTALLRVLQLNILAVYEFIKGNYDAVICGDIPYTMVGLIAKLYKKPFILNSHEMYWALGLSYGRNFEKIWQVFEKMLLKMADLWFIPSKERAELTLKIQGIERDYVVYENFPIFKKRDDGSIILPLGKRSCVSTDKLIVMFQGSLVNNRGLEQLIDAAKSKLFHLVIQGSGIMEPFIRESLDENMTLLPRCLNEETMNYLSCADLSFVYYINNSLNSAYACSNKFYSSVFAGIPILCNRLPAFEIFEKEYGGVVFFDDLSPSEIVQTVQKLVDNSAGYKALKSEVLFAREKLVKIPREKKILNAFESLDGLCFNKTGKVEHYNHDIS